MKKCIMCEKPAMFCIKHCNDYYCKECAHEHFNDLTFLVLVEKQAEALKQAMEH